jgi:Ca-activated chloride channel family protein
VTWPAWKPIAFANPHLLWVLLLLPALALWRSRRGPAPAVVYSSLLPFRAIGAPRKSRFGGWLFTLFLVGCGFLILALARPQQTDISSRIKASGIDIMIAIDVSGSMMAEDVQIGSDRANRIEAVKKVTEDFIAARKNDRIGLLAFAGRPYLVSPLTLDHDWVLRNLERVRIGLVEDGTAIGSALASAANRLKDRKEAKSRIIVLLTDGANNAGRVTPPDAAEAAHAVGVKIYTIGVGTKGRARIPVSDGFGNKVYRWIEPDLDEPLLKKIAEVGTGEFYRATDGSTLRRVFDQIDKLEKTSVEMTELKNQVDLFPWFVAVGVFFLLLHFLTETVFRRSLP